jgi:hypothetical protein
MYHALPTSARKPIPADVRLHDQGTRNRSRTATRCLGGLQPAPCRHVVSLSEVRRSWALRNKSVTKPSWLNRSLLGSTEGVRKSARRRLTLSPVPFTGVRPDPGKSAMLTKRHVPPLSSRVPRTVTNGLVPHGMARVGRIKPIRRCQAVARLSRFGFGLGRFNRIWGYLCCCRWGLCASAACLRLSGWKAPGVQRTLPGTLPPSPTVCVVARP